MMALDSLAEATGRIPRGLLVFGALALQALACAAGVGEGSGPAGDAPGASMPASAPTEHWQLFAAALVVVLLVVALLLRRAGVLKLHSTAPLTGVAVLLLAYLSRATRSRNTAPRGS